MTPASAQTSTVTSLVLCSVADGAAVLAELRRVMRPGGELRFYEHVASIEPRVARWRGRVDRIWGLVSGDCHINQDTACAIGDAGFLIEDEDRFLFPPCRLARLSAEHILGRARRSVEPAGPAATVSPALSGRPAF